MPTFKWSNSCVCSYVNIKLLLSQILLFTITTVKHRSIAMVEFLMKFQSRLRFKGGQVADITGEDNSLCINSSVNTFLMVLQVSLILETFSTLRADEWSVVWFM